MGAGTRLFVRLSPPATHALRKGEHWFMAHELVKAPEPTALRHPSGDLVTVRSLQDQHLGLGIFSPTSVMPLRLCHTSQTAPDPSPDLPTYLRGALAQAIGRRRELGLAPEAGVRLVLGDADRLPGLTVDQFAQCVVVQTSTPAMEGQLLPVLLPELLEQTGAASVVARNDKTGRRREGLDSYVRVLHGDPSTDRVVITEDGVQHIVEPVSGQKTGFYLDQRLTRARVRELAAGRRVLDVFSYAGAMSMAALAGGAASAVAVDQSRAALDQAQTTARLNGVEDRFEVICGDSKKVMEDLIQRGERFDLVVVDPPAAARSPAQVQKAMQFYHFVCLDALRLLAPRGILVLCSCTAQLPEHQMQQVLIRAAALQGMGLLVRDRLGLPPDHPVLLSTHTLKLDYLKVIVAQRVD